MPSWSRMGRRRSPTRFGPRTLQQSGWSDPNFAVSSVFHVPPILAVQAAFIRSVGLGTPRSASVNVYLCLPAVPLHGTGLPPNLTPNSSISLLEQGARSLGIVAPHSRGPAQRSISGTCIARTCHTALEPRKSSDKFRPPGCTSSRGLALHPSSVCTP